LTRPFYVTTPIYYVNDSPHIGHAYTTIAADMLKRFHKLAGREAFLLTGTDEHGSKIAEAAQAAGLSEIEFCDRTVKTFTTLWKTLSIDNDDFIRTTSPRHEQAVRRILDALRASRTDGGEDVIYTSDYEGLYCTGCEKFLTEKDLVDGLCPEHLRKPELLKEKNYFFRLSAFIDKIRDKIESGEMRVLPDERRREVLGLLKQDLPDFSLSRERVKWGIPLTFDPSQSAYVWVDALTNYISAIGYADDPASFRKWWRDAETVHLMAKDSLKFHCVFWPAMLMAAGEKLPETIFLHGYFTVDGKKMSKSLGNKIDPVDMVRQFGPDATRYLLLTQYPFGYDGDVQASRFVVQYNSDLANDLGNLVSRVAKMVVANCDGKLPAPGDDIAELTELKAQAEKLVDSAYAHITGFRLGAAIEEAMNLVRATNKFFADTEPWKLVKAGQPQRFGGILRACCEALRIVSVVLFPIMPDKMREVRAVFGLDDTTLSLADARTFYGLRTGGTVAIAESVFPRLDAKKTEAPAPAKKADSKPPEAKRPDTAEDALLDIADFARADLRVSEVLRAERVEGADRLLKLQINTGLDERQIIAGVAAYYTPEEMVGRKIIVVTNLKPAVIRGVESRGMLLAARKGDKLCLLKPDGDLPVGAKIS